MKNIIQIEPIIQLYISGAKIKTIQNLYGGAFNTTKLVLLSGGRRVVLQVSPNLPDALPYEKNLLKANAQVYELGRNHGICFPNVLGFGLWPGEVSQSYLLTEYIDGRAMILTETSDQEKKRSFFEAGEMIKSLHDIEGRSFGRVASIGTETKSNNKCLWSETIIDEFLQWRDRAEEYGVFDSTVCDTAAEMFVHYKDCLDEISVPYLCHGDLWMGNLLIRQSQEGWRLVGVVDADHAMWGDPDFDFPYGRGMGLEFMKGYGRHLESESALVRRKLYSLFYAFRQSYILAVRMNDTEQSLPQKAIVRKILS